MTISQVYFGSTVGGPTSGSFQTVVELSKEGSTFSVPDLLALLLQWTQEKPSPIRITGELEAATQEEMLAFCSTLKDFNYVLSLLTDGQSRPNWFYLIPYIIVELKAGRPWLRFICQELRAEIKPGFLVEPPLPPKPCPSYLIPGDGLRIEDLFDFLRRASQPWGVILSPKHTYIKTLYQSKGGNK